MHQIAASQSAYIRDGCWGSLRPPHPAHRCVPPLLLHPRIADQVDAQAKVVGLVPVLDLSICSKINCTGCYSITLSAREISVGGSEIPSAFVALRLMMSCTFVGI